jgi:hypothetical protein
VTRPLNTSVPILSRKLYLSISFWVNVCLVIGILLPIISASRQTNTPQSQPFPCCGESACRRRIQSSLEPHRSASDNFVKCMDNILNIFNVSSRNGWASYAALKNRVIQKQKLDHKNESERISYSPIGVVVNNFTRRKKYTDESPVRIAMIYWNK